MRTMNPVEKSGAFIWLIKRGMLVRTVTTTDVFFCETLKPLRFERQYVMKDLIMLAFSRNSLVHLNYSPLTDTT